MQSSILPHEEESLSGIKKEEKYENGKAQSEQNGVTQTPKTVEIELSKNPKKSAEGWMFLLEKAILIAPLLETLLKFGPLINGFYSSSKQTEVDKLKIESHTNIEIEKIKADKELKLASIHAEIREKELAFDCLNKWDEIVTKGGRPEIAKAFQNMANSNLARIEEKSRPSLQGMFSPVSSNAKSNSSGRSSPSHAFSSVTIPPAASLVPRRRSQSSG